MWAVHASHWASNKLLKNSPIMRAFGKEKPNYRSHYWEFDDWWLGEAWQGAEDLTNIHKSYPELCHASLHKRNPWAVGLCSVQWHNMPPNPANANRMSNASNVRTVFYDGLAYCSDRIRDTFQISTSLTCTSVHPRGARRCYENKKVDTWYTYF